MSNCHLNEEATHTEPGEEAKSGIRMSYRMAGQPSLVNLASSLQSEVSMQQTTRTPLARYFFCIQN
jgi:hypothetical protein